MHIADPETGNLGANAIVGGSAGIATGAALSAKMRGTDQVAVCFFGEGALGQGLLYEVMNMASLWKLPVIYVCENNLYNEYTHYSETTAGRSSPHAPRAFGIHAEEVDGQDVRAVYDMATATWWQRARRGEGPAFLICHTYRYLRASRRRYQPRVLSLQRRRASMGGRARPAQAAGRMADGEQQLCPTSRSCDARSKRDVRAEIDRGVAVCPATRPIPDSSEVDQHVYA